MPKGYHNNQISGSRHHKWNGSLKSEHGYAKVRVGLGHPLADPNGYTYEHLVVWCAAGNTRPSADEVIHHINGDKLDNRIENLEVMDRGQHNAHHNAKRQRDEHGRFLPKAAGRLLDGREWNEQPINHTQP